MPITLDGTTGITTPSYGGTDIAEYLVPVTAFKNRILNGQMQIDQRNAGASVTPSTVGTPEYVLDRWFVWNSPASKYSVQQNAGLVTPPLGFTNYLGVTSLSAYSVASSDYQIIGQRIEGFNTADLQWGTANAKTITLSFWVRSSLTGTFSGSLRNSANNRFYGFSYTISSANTWEQKSVTIVGDTTGTWIGATNGIGIDLGFNLALGTTYTGTLPNAWGSSAILGPTGTTSVVGTNGATFYITGVQLEVGSTATSFDYRPYGTELQLCQRYYQYYYGASGKMSQPASSGTYVAMPVYYKATMRATPTVTWNAPSLGTAGFVEQWGGTQRAVSTNDVTANNLAYVILSSAITTADTISGNLTLVAEL